MMRHRESRLLRLLGRVHRDDGGTAAVTFILCLPIFLMIVGIIVQYALLINAKMMVTNAAAAAGRAAMTSLPEETPENVKKAACFMLVPISPKSPGGSAEGQALADALSSLNAKVTPDFAARYAYAESAVEVIYPPLDFKYLPGQDIEVTVRYKFYLTVPFAMGVLSPGTSNVGGVSGRFFTIESKVRVQTAHGRAAASNDTGWAQ